MADFYTGRQLIIDRLRASGAWTATPAGRLVFMGDATFDPGASPAPFCVVEIIGGESTPYVGRPSNRLHRDDGLIVMHFMEPVGSGFESIAAMHRNARDLLAAQSFSGVTVMGLSAGGGRPSSEDGNYHGATATAPFFYLYLTS